ncbi:uncharacterized protein LOC135829607 [Sycon ciliatum]|uniref:uncharacterized protein LOC135829607 n=1 Tax=Sycon ciliatum TaxID=27933 RepID=UPI0031F6B28A
MDKRNKRRGGKWTRANMQWHFLLLASLMQYLPAVYSASSSTGGPACSAPIVQNGTTSMTGNTTTAGSTVHVTCNTGFALVGSASATCSNGSQWQPELPTCQDENECTSYQHNCPPPMTCFNSQGSYHCHCLSGFAANTSATGPCPACVSPWTQITPGSMYCGLALNGTYTYRQATALCQAQPEGDAWLPRVFAKRDNDDLAGFIQGDTWIGASRNTKGQFHWAGTKYSLMGTSYWNWDRDEPNSSYADAAVMMMSSHAELGLWRVVSKSDRLHVLCVRDLPACLPPLISNGDIGWDSFYLGSSINIICSAGAILIGHDTITCNETVEWTPDAPVCVRPPDILTGLMDQHVQYGENISFTLSARGNPKPSITWWRNGHQISQEKVTTSDLARTFTDFTVLSSLTIPDVQQGGVGTYTCAAATSHGLASNTSATLTAYVVSRQLVVTGQSVDFACDISESLSASTRWYRNGTELNSDDLLGRVSFYKGDNVLTIFRAELTDSGLYYCTEHGSLGAKRSNNYTSLLLHSPPVLISPIPESIVAFAGAYLQVFAMFYGYTEPSVVWCVRDNGQCEQTPVPQCGSMNQTTTSFARDTLTFHTIEPCAAAEYDIVASNTAGTTTHHTIIDVKEVAHVGIQGTFGYHLQGTLQHDRISTVGVRADFSKLMSSWIGQLDFKVQHFEYQSFENSTVQILADIEVKANLLTQIDRNVSVPNIRTMVTALLRNASTPLQLVGSSLQDFQVYDVCQAEETDVVARGKFSWRQAFAGKETTAECGIRVDESIVRYATRWCMTLPRRHNYSLVMGKWRQPRAGHCPSRITIQLFNISQDDFQAKTQDEIQLDIEAISNLTSTPDDLNPDDIDYASIAIFKAVWAADHTRQWDVAVLKRIAKFTLKSINNIGLASPYNLRAPAAARLIKSMEKILKIIPLKYGEVFQAHESEVAFALASQLPGPASDSIQTQFDPVNNTFNMAPDSSTDGAMQDTSAFSSVSVSIPKSAITEATNNIPDSAHGMYPVASTSVILYQSRSLFHDRKLSENTSVVSDIVSAQVGLETVDVLEDPVLITFDLLSGAQRETDEIKCVYWDFNLADGTGGWQDEGCNVSNSTMSPNSAACECYHMAHFAVLLIRNMTISGTTTAETVLKFISIIGCAVAMVALLLTNVVIVSIKKLRQRHHHQMVFGQCATLLLFMSAFIVVLYHEPLENSHHSCRGLAIVLHFLLLCGFMFTSVDATFLYKQTVIVFEEISSTMQHSLHVLILGIPVIFVGLSAAITGGEAYGGQDLCWINSDSVFYAALVLPVAICLGYNIVVLLAVVITMRKSGKNLAASSAKKTTSRRAMLAMVVSISILLGLTWVFGFLLLIYDNLVFQYIFAVLTSLQGLAIFAHVVRSREAKASFQTLFKKSQPRSSRRSGFSQRVRSYFNLSSTKSTSDGQSKHSRSISSLFSTKSSSSLAAKKVSSSKLPSTSRGLQTSQDNLTKSFTFASSDDSSSPKQKGERIYLSVDSDQEQSSLGLEAVGAQSADKLYSPHQKNGIAAQSSKRFKFERYHSVISGPA